MSKIVQINMKIKNLTNYVRNKYDSYRYKYSFRLSDQLFFAQRLSLLLDSNISLMDALQMMKNIEKSKYRKKLYSIIIIDCEHGVSLFKSLVSSQVLLESLLLTLINNGESSGSLSSSLLQAYEYLYKKNELKKKFISIMLYPVFILCATIGMALFLVLYIFPKILPLLGSLNIRLPLITRIVRSIYEISSSYGIWFVLFSILIFVSIFILIKRNYKIQVLRDRFLFRIPILGNYIKINILFSVCSTGEMLLSSGKSLHDMHKFSIGSVKNIIIKKAFENIYEDSLRGVSFSTSMKSSSFTFPQTMIDMCEIGERTGNLAKMFKHISNIFEQDIDTFLKRFSSLIEPSLMIFMGLIIGSIALSIILPVYEITNHLTK